MRRTLFTIIIALLGVTGAWAKETTHTVKNLIYTVVQPGTGENYAILSGYENSPEGILDIPGLYWIFRALYRWYSLEQSRSKFL